MKNLVLILKRSILALSILLIYTTAFADNQEEKKIEHVTFHVEMDCMECVKRIEKNIPFEKGVKNLEVDLKNQIVKVSYKTKVTNKEQLKTAIEKLEFKVEEQKE